MNNEEREIVIHWDDFVGAISKIDGPNQEDLNEIHSATHFLRGLVDCNISARELIDIPDSQFQRAHSIANPYETNLQPLVGHARLMFDEHSWDELLHQCMKLPSTCDPSIAEVFI